VVGFGVASVPYSPLVVAAWCPVSTSWVRSAMDSSERWRPVAGDPLVVGVDEDRADESDDGRGVGEGPDDSAAALDLLVDPFDYPAVAVGASVSVVLIIAGGRC
jgi:hypothetical protein